MSDHILTNQENYKLHAIEHDMLGFQCTYLAYRDLPQLLDQYLIPQEQYTVLDYGCGSGVSTQAIEKIFRENNYAAQYTSIDISKENLALAALKMPDKQWKLIEPDSFIHLDQKFDAIFCNFVLVENKTDQIQIILNNIKSLLHPQGIAILINCCSEMYNPAHTWTFYENHYPKNKPHPIYTEDEPLKITVYQDADKKNGYTFFDYYHSEDAYKDLIKKSNLKLLHAHYPFGKTSDQIPWKSETTKPIYHIYIVGLSE